MRTVEVKNINTGKIVWRGHYWSFYQAKALFCETKECKPGNYAIAGTNSSSCNPVVSKKAWQSSESFVIPKGAIAS